MPDTCQLCGGPLSLHPTRLYCSSYCSWRYNYLLAKIRGNSKLRPIAKNNLELRHQMIRYMHSLKSPKHRAAQTPLKPEQVLERQKDRERLQCIRAEIKSYRKKGLKHV